MLLACDMSFVPSQSTVVLLPIIEQFLREEKGLLDEAILRRYAKSYPSAKLRSMLPLQCCVNNPDFPLETYSRLRYCVARYSLLQVVSSSLEIWPHSIWTAWALRVVT